MPAKALLISEFLLAEETDISPYFIQFSFHLIISQSTKKHKWSCACKIKENAGPKD
jgi:hypothetical protein